MKLYTEEQMSVAINAAKANPEQAYLIQTMLKPIELPSDEEIDASKFSSSNPEQELYNDGYEQGAKWMRDKLTNTKEK